MSEERIAILEERVSNWMNSTTSYRKELCHKIEAILAKLETLPCKERTGIYTNLSKTVDEIQDSRKRWHFIFVGMVATTIGAALTIGIAWGSLQTNITSLKAKIENIK
jgi:hypothetical protein